MTVQPAPSNHPVFLLAEHLDMILAAIEDLQACTPAIIAADSLRAGAVPLISMRRFVHDLKCYEMIAIARIGRARELTRELVRRDKRFAMLGGLFVAGTAAPDEAMRQVTDTTGEAFAAGGDPVGYLRARGVIDPEAGTIGSGAGPEIGDAFRLAGLIETGPLVDLVATFLNAIELHFDLFPDLAEGSDVRGDLSALVN